MDLTKRKLRSKFVKRRQSLMEVNQFLIVLFAFCIGILLFNFTKYWSGWVACLLLVAIQLLREWNKRIRQYLASHPAD